jgi:hypothetical protein
MELQLIELTIDDIELDRVEAIAFVDNPAIQRNWMAFNADENKYQFKTADEEKRIVAGPLMVADMPIYRNFEGKEFFVKFSATTIEQIVNKFMKEGRINAFNKMHNEADKLDGVYLQQSFIIDSTKGINTPMGFEAMADGSWFGFVKIDNDQVWSDYVKTGQLKGFSVEGNFSEKNKFQSNNIMTKIEQFMEKLSKKLFSEEEKPAEETTEVTMGSAKLTDGTVVKWEGELAEGIPVMLEDGSGAPDGEHTFEDGTVIAVEGGIVIAVKKPEGESEMQAPQVNEEMEAVKLQIAELAAKIEGLKPTDYSAQFAKIDETNKLMFETIKAFMEAKDETATKDKFKKAEVAAAGIGERAARFLEMNKK